MIAFMSVFLCTTSAFLIGWVNAAYHYGHYDVMAPVAVISVLCSIIGMRLHILRFKRFKKKVTPHEPASR